MKIYSLKEKKAIELLKAMEKQYHELLTDVVSALMEALKVKDMGTYEHSIRVAQYAVFLARALKLSHEELITVELGALFHDLGKIGVPDGILLKPGHLTLHEFEIMKNHSLKSAQILSKIRAFKEIVPIVKCHQEKLDGTGYPAGLSGQNIPFLARLTYIVDAFDAMVSERPYRKGIPEEAALKELKKYAGTQFDSELVKVFVKAYQTSVRPLEMKSQFIMGVERKKVIGE